MENLQIDLNRLGEWAVENTMKINPTKGKAVCFTRARVTEPINYSLQDIAIPEASEQLYSKYHVLGNHFTQRFKLG
jgi:hypothetical protein